MNAMVSCLMGAVRLCGAALFGLAGAGIFWIVVELDNDAVQKQNASSITLNTIYGKEEAR